jgi:hypothetical protein
MADVRLPRRLVTIVPFARVLCKMSSDVYRMARKELCHDRDAVLLLAGHLRGAGTGAAKPNAKTRGTGSVLKSGVW